MQMPSTRRDGGHLLGASGSVELAATLLCAERDGASTINQEEPDPNAVGLWPNTAREYKWNTMLLNSFGFGGQNACLIVRRFV
jgi:3-oxoacyl-[acyl-carrier-protein] synthase II